jgi:prepilin-type N-terminal cleavage/methylation domain-containing protein
MHYRTKGFTVLELLITIVIIGILGSIITGSYLYFVDKARYVHNRQLIHQLVQTISCVQNDNRGYSLTELDKEAMITFYEYYLEVSLDDKRLHDVGMSADEHLIIIVTYQDAFTAYNYHLNEYFHTTDVNEIAGLIEQKIETVIGRLKDEIVLLDPIRVLGIPTIPMGTKEFYLFRYETEAFTCDIYFRKAMIDETVLTFDASLGRSAVFSEISKLITINTIRILKEKAGGLTGLKFLVYKGYKNNLSNDTMFAFTTNDLIGAYDHNYNFILRIS